MVNRAQLVLLLLAVPVIGFVVATATRTSLDSQVRTELRRQYPSATTEQLSDITVAQLCEESSLSLSSLCLTDLELTLVSWAAVIAGGLGLMLILLIRVAGGMAGSNRQLLVRLFRPGLYVTVIALIGLVLAHAAIAMGGLYLAESVLIQRVHVGAIAAIGLGALMGVASMARASILAVRKATATVLGYSLTPQQSPELWAQVRATAKQMGALEPQHVVVGLDPNFFVTEADVRCLNGDLRGRTLYCSLPLCRILSTGEFLAIVGHELGHFKGLDTQFSERFYPIYRGTSTSLEALQASETSFAGSLALYPAIAVLSYFLESFSLAERRMSREREFTADAEGARVTGPELMAAALVKTHAFAPVWAGFEDAAADALRQGQMYPNASLAFAGAVRASASPDSLDGVMERHTSHPTDSHPPLADRLASLRIELSQVQTAALDVQPAVPALSLVAEADTVEQALSHAYQTVLAHHLQLQPQPHPIGPQDHAGA